MWGPRGTQWGLPQKEWQQIPVGLGPFLIGTLGLLATAGWLLYRALSIEVTAGVSLAVVLVILVAIFVAGACFSYFRDVKGYRTAAIIQIMAAGVGTVWIIVGSSEPSRWLAVLPGIVTVANGFKVLFDQIKKKRIESP